MIQQEDLKPLADRYAKSLTGETALFNQFLIDYFEKSPRNAFETLLATASQNTRACAEDFNARFINESLTHIQETMEGAKINPSTRQAHVLQDFFKEYFETGKFDIAFRKVQDTINADPELSKDKEFKTYMGKIAEEIKPKMKEQADYNNQEDEGAFIKVRPGLAKNVEQKLSDYKVMKIMEESLKKFYTANASERQKKRSPPDTSHDVESIYKRRQIPLALQLARQDTLGRSEKTSIEIRELNSSIMKVKALHLRGSKFDFTKADLEKAKAERLQQPKTNTEKMEVIRDLVIDLQSHPGAQAFGKAMDKVLDFGDKELMKVLEKNYPALTGPDKTLEGQTSMLMDGYKLYLKIDTTLYKDDVKKETELLTRGVKAEPVKLAIDELFKKGESKSTAEALNSLFHRAIHAASQDKRHVNNFAQEVEAIAKKTSLEIEIEKARSQPPAQSQEPGKGVGINLN